MLSVLVACAVWSAFASPAPLASTPAAADTIPAAPDLFDAPVYYERNRERYMRAGDLELLRAGRVRVQHYEPVDVSEFAWSRAGTEYTWWMQMQEMRFLLPLIASERASDRALAREWLRRWFTTHVLGDVRKNQWGEPMTFAYRAMVFVYYLKTERLRAHPDAEAVGMLTTCILSHQQHLTPDIYFEKESNHGLIDALGLLETTRVFPNPEVRELALHRIRDMVSRSLSTGGVHMEHAPAYHFAFLRWLDEILEYAEDVPGIDRDFVASMAWASARMHNVGYFLQDHRGWIPPIGDTDSVSVDYYSSKFRFQRPPGDTPYLYDLEAGYAIFKGARRDRRYVVFRQPSQRFAMPAHAHSDALAVFMESDGEVLLGDAGRYSYTPGPVRDYFKSAAAHSTVQPPGRSGAIMLPIVSAPRDASTGSEIVWTADLMVGAVQASRVVRVPSGGRDLVVNDAFFAASAAPDSGAPQSVTVLWNLGKDVTEVVAVPNTEAGTWAWALETRRGQRARVELTVRGEPLPVANVQLSHGRHEPMAGWYSPKQSVKRPVPIIEATLNVENGAYLETRVRLHRR